MFKPVLTFAFYNYVSYLKSTLIKIISIYIYIVMHSIKYSFAYMILAYNKFNPLHSYINI